MMAEVRAGQAERKRTPVARGLPLVGILPQLVTDGPNALVQLAQQHEGEVVRLNMGPSRAYLVTHPDHVQYVLRTNAGNFSRVSPPLKAAKRLLGEGFILEDDEPAAQSRRLLQPMFTPKRLAFYADSMVGIATAWLARLALLPPGQTVTMEHEMSRLTGEISLSTLFGGTIDPLEADRLRGLLADAIGTLDLRTVLYFMPEWVPLPGDRKFRDALRSIDDLVFHIIRSAPRGSEDRHDLLSILLCARESGVEMSDRKIRDDLLTVFIGGFETAAINLTWLWYVLEQHPEVYRRLRDEVHAVLGERPPTLADLANLSYTKRVIQETLRLYPPAWVTHRLTRSADVIGGHVVEAGSSILVCFRATHRLQEFWASPDVFDPDRFEPALIKERHRYAHVPFGAGPRVCIGAQLAMMEMQIIVATMVQRFRLRLVPGHPVKYRSGPVLHSRHGMPMILERVGGGQFPCLVWIRLGKDLDRANARGYHATLERAERTWSTHPCARTSSSSNANLYNYCDVTVGRARRSRDCGSQSRRLLPCCVRQGHMTPIVKRACSVEAGMATGANRRTPATVRRAAGTAVARSGLVAFDRVI